MITALESWAKRGRLQLNYLSSPYQTGNMMIKTLKCVLSGVLLSLYNMKIIEGHKYREVENDSYIMTLRCERCGKKSIAYYR